MDHPQFTVHAATEESHWWFHGRLAIVQSLLTRILPPSKDTIIIDAGCGTGGMSGALIPSYDVRGIDPVEEAIAFARKKFPTIPFRVGSVPEDIQDWLKEAKGIVLLDVLEHVEEDFLFVSTLLAAMRPGTFLLLTAPADPTLWGEHDRGFAHCRRYTMERMRSLWKDLPVTELCVSPINARLYWIVKCGRWLSRFLGRSLGPGSTDLGMPMRPINALLQWIFGGEKHRLLKVLELHGKPYRHGVSILALLQREPGEIVPRGRPANLPPDEAPWLRNV
ncbi:MAG: class I SAM-dependent methyltransferase [Candidatus Peregrinibacteria bacterium]